MVAIQKKHRINSPIGGCRSTQLVCNRYIAMAVALLYAVIMIVLLQRSNNNIMIDTQQHDRKLHTITSTDDVSSSSSNQYYASIVKEIITKWNITTPNAAYLLEQQFYTSNNNEYNPQIDFLHFPHIPKTGGTSISDLLRDIFGSDHVLPGSARSAPFNYAALHSSTQITKDYDNDPLQQRSNSYLVSYAHTRLRPTHGPNRTRFSAFLQQRIINGGRRRSKKKRRIRLLQMLREPMDLRASTHAMAMCGINGQVKAFNEEIRSSNSKKEGRLKSSKKYKPKCTPEEGLNISALWDNVVWKAMSKCSSHHLNNTTATTNNNANTTTTAIRLDRFDKILCKRGPAALDICRSPTTLLSSPQYKIGMRSLLLDLMGRFVGNEEMGRYTDHYYLHHSSLNTTTTTKEELSDGRGVGFTTMKTEEYTLIDLGGLDVNNIMYTPYYRGYDIAASIRRRTTTQQKTIHQQQQQQPTSSANTINNNDQAEPDILWFGISERMTESICLLYYTLKVKPLPKIPTQRVMTCPTTGWWTETHRMLVKQMEQADYAVWRVANAILDVRLIRMKNDIQYKLDNEDELLLTNEEKELNRALVEAGCLSL